MIVGNIVIKRARTIRKRIQNRNSKDKILLERMLQIYNCRLFGLCIYRTENDYIKMKQRILKG